MEIQEYSASSAAHQQVETKGKWVEYMQGCFYRQRWAKLPDELVKIIQKERWEK